MADYTFTQTGAEMQDIFDKAFTQIIYNKFVNTNLVWVPNANTKFVEIIVVGGGGGGGGVQGVPSIGYAAAGSGGGGGGYTRNIFQSIATSYTIVTGAGGAGGIGSTPPSDGSDTTVTPSPSGSIMTGEGGKAGVSRSGSSGIVYTYGGFGGDSSGGGDMNSSGGDASNSSTQSGTIVNGGVSGGSYMGNGMQSRGANGRDANNYGVGGGSCYISTGSQTFTGGAGGDGIVIIKEYI